jgi:WD40 repeat protein
MLTNRLLCLSGALAALACTDTTLAPDARRAQTFARADGDHHTVVVNPNANGNAIAATIQDGIDMVEPGGKVQIKAGTYAEAIVINKGLTLEAIGDGSEPVIIAPPGAPAIAVQVATSDPVTLRDLEVRFSGPNGIRGDGAVDITVERISMLAVNPPAGRGYMLSAVNDPNTGGGRAHLAVRESFFDGTVPNSVPGTTGPPQMFGIVAQGDVDASFEGNVVRRTGGACLLVLMRTDGGGVLNATLLNNDLDLCHPSGRVAAIIVGAPATLPATQVTATGIVNLVGNTVRNSDGSCLAANGIVYEFGTGVIEHNVVNGFVQSCTGPSARSNPAAIWVGSTRKIGGVPIPAASPVVRFNDIVGNAQAGLRVGPNQVTPLDARCNWWGAASGPSGPGPAATGDALVVETGASAPGFAPWATAPIAQPHDATPDRCHRDPEWSEPVNLGPVVNSTANEFAATLDNDGLNLYFGSGRAGGLGGVDIWTSHRACLDCPWEAPTNLGPTINTSATDNGPSLSTDGRLLFFSSTRSGGQGDVDIYVSRRATPGDPWGPPLNLGPYVNSSTADMGQEYVENEGDGLSTMYFNRGVGLQADLYVVTLNRNGEPLGPAQLVPELSAPNANDAGVSLRSDQREILFFSTRPGTFGPADIWGSTRAAIADPWSLPENLGAPLNTRFSDNRPNLWRDRRTLLFDSDRPGGSGGSDIWISTRTRIP